MTEKIKKAGSIEKEELKKKRRDFGWQNGGEQVSAHKTVTNTFFMSFYSKGRCGQYGLSVCVCVGGGGGTPLLMLLISRGGGGGGGKEEARLLMLLN